jgi:hypothetical protein
MPWQGPHLEKEQHSQWRGEHATAETKRKRARRWFKDLGTCERCHEKPATDRHHADGNTGNNDRANVRFLCRRCHMVEDGRLDAFVAGNKQRQPQPAKPCAECGKPYKPLRRGQCASCYSKAARRKARVAP